MIDELRADGADGPLATLVTLLRAASKLLERLRGDQRTFLRLLGVVARMPEEDREPVLAILEREVAWREMADGAVLGLPSGLRVNPGARLYLRVYDAATPVFPPEEVAAALSRASRVLQAALAGPPDSRESLVAAIRGVYLAQPPRERAAVELCCDTVVAARDERVAAERRRDGDGGA